MIDVHLAIIDYLIIGIYLVFVIGLGFYFRKKQGSETDYFLAGRSVLWPVIGFSLFASNMGSISLVGLAESGYSFGFAVFSYEWMAAIVLILFAVFFLPFYLKNKIYTVPQFLEKRYSPFARYYFSTVTILLNVFIDIASGLFAGAIVVKMAFPALSIVSIIWIISIIAAIYTLMGGLASVVYSDTVQAILLLISSIVITIIAYQKVGGWSQIVSGVDPVMLDIIRPIDDATLPWPGLFSGVFLLGFYFWITNQFIVQRALAAKEIKQGQWGAMWAGLLKMLTLFIMVLPGVMALLLYPELDDAKNAYPTLVFDLLPTGLLGLTLAGFIAALMSSVDSGLNAAATLFTMDFYKKRNPQAGVGKTLKVAKIMIIVFMIIAALWAPHINSFESFWDYLQMVLSFLCPPVVALFTFGLFSKKVNKHGANAAIVVGLTLSVISIAYKIFSTFYMDGVDILPHYLYLAGIIFIACSLVLIGVSYAYPDDEEKDWDKLIWTPEYFKGETKALSGMIFYYNYRYQAVGLLLIIIVLLVVF
ncbi:MAG: sodium/solute symporter [Rhodothermaceae bacterium]|nr:sodium/solute symporter [Rhodothermaceae bacterium]